MVTVDLDKKCLSIAVYSLHMLRINSFVNFTILYRSKTKIEIYCFKTGLWHLDIKILQINKCISGYDIDLFSILWST